MGSRKQIYVNWSITVLYWLLLCFVSYGCFFSDTAMAFIPLLTIVFLWLRFKQNLVKGQLWRHLLYLVSCYLLIALMAAALWGIMMQTWMEQDFLFIIWLSVGVGLQLALGSLSFGYNRKQASVWQGAVVMMLLLIGKYLSEKSGIEISDLPYFYVFIAMWQGVLFVFTQLSIQRWINRIK